MSEFTIDGPLEASTTFGCGHLTITTSQDGTASATVGPLDPSDARATALAERASIRLEGRVLHVDAHERGWRQSSARLDVRLALPAGSDVTVAAGQLTFSAEDPLGAINVKVGDMTMDVGDATSIAIMSGRTTLRSGSVGDVSLQAGQATVDLQRTSGKVRVKGAAVDFDLREVGSGDVVVETATGHAEVGVTRGTLVQLDLTSRTGVVRCDIPLEDGAGGESGAALRLKLKSATGSIVVSQAGAA
jgi:hypothetical protein